MQRRAVLYRHHQHHRHACVHVYPCKCNKGRVDSQPAPTPTSSAAGSMEPRNPTWDSKGPSSCLCMDAGLTTDAWCSSTQCAMYPLPPHRLQQRPQAFYCQDQVVGKQASRISAMLLRSPITALPVKGASSSTMPGCSIPDTSTSSLTPPSPNTRHQVTPSCQTHRPDKPDEPDKPDKPDKADEPDRSAEAKTRHSKTRHLATVPPAPQLQACYSDQTQPPPPSPQPA
ncbi:hypothetical protein V8C86DRAFT_1225093 [Haematococcus lacustris]